MVTPRKTDLTEIYKDITLQPYGCFSSLDEKFFSKQINPYSKNSVFDSGILINNDSDIRQLIQQVINNGFDKYGYNILNKYESIPDGYKKMNIIEIGILGKLAGYNYLSIYKIDETTRGRIYLTYSPPMDDDIDGNIIKTDLPGYTLTPKINKYTNEEEKAPGKELSCGHPCMSNDQILKYDSDKQYMCGSTAYPNIKTPSRFAVYHIKEKV